MTTKRKHTGNRFGADLDREEFYDSQGRRIDEDYVEAAVAEVERDDVQLDETRAEFPRRGRPSLSGQGERSPRVDVRVARAVKDDIIAVAHRQGRQEAEVVREALEEYLARH